MKTLTVLLVGAVLACGSAAHAANVALNKTVTKLSGSGTFGGTPAAVTDGTFLTETTAWNDLGTLFWAVDGTIEIDLGGPYSINGAIVQADNNDTYLLSYHRISDDTWVDLWSVPQSPNFYGGVITRPGGEDRDTWQAVGPVVTDKVQFKNTSGDGSYSVSEIQLLGVPEPGIMGLLMAGSLNLMLRRRSK